MTKKSREKSPKKGTTEPKTDKIITVKQYTELDIHQFAHLNVCMVPNAYGMSYYSSHNPLPHQTRRIHKNTNTLFSTNQHTYVHLETPEHIHTLTHTHMTRKYRRYVRRE